MPLPAGFPYLLKQEVEIPLEQIIPNPDQPRQVIFKETIEELAASLKAEGQRTAAKARPLTEAEKAAHPGVWIMLIGGHRRRLAALLNGSQTLKCIVEDISPEDTFLAALMDNAYEDMSPWEWDLAIERISRTFTGTLEELAVRVNKGLTKVNGALKIGRAFNSTARALVNENLQKTLKNVVRSANAKNKGFLISEDIILILAGLEDPELVLQALRVVLDEYLPPVKTQELVKHIKAGQAADTYSTAVRSSKLESSESKPTTPNSTLQNSNSQASSPSLQTPHSSSAQLSPTPKPSAEPKQESHPIASTHAPLTQSEALTLLGQQTKKAVHFLTSQKVIHWFKKLGEWLAKIGWRGLVKYEHHIIRSIAHYIVPVKQFSASTHHSHRRTSFSLPTMVAMILHWFVYTLLQLTLWWLILTWLTSRFVPFLRPWVKWPFHWLAHELFGVVPHLIWPGMLHDFVTALMVILLLVGIFMAAKAQPARMAVLGVVIGLLWNYGRGNWTVPTETTSGVKLESSNATPVTPASTTTPTTSFETAKPAVSKAPKKITSASVPTAVVATPTPVAKKPDIADDVLKQAAPAGVDAVRHLLPF